MGAGRHRVAGGRGPNGPSSSPTCVATIRDVRSGGGTGSRVGVQIRELQEIVRRSGDAAFAVDSIGVVVAWNAAAEALFGIQAGDAIGKFCCDLLNGTDESGVVCGPNCSVQAAVRRHQPITNYDIEVATAKGRGWCNSSVLIVEVANSTRPYSIHIWRSIDVTKRFDMLLRDVVVQATGLPADAARRGISEAKSPAHVVDLSKRESEVLRLLALGKSTREISSELHIHTTTVNNHVAHILEKLDAHSRLEAVRRAEQAGLI